MNSEGLSQSLYSPFELPEREANRKAQSAILARQQRKSVMLVKPLCRVILGIDQYREHAQFGARDTQHGISQQDTAKTFAPIILSHGETPQQGGGHHRIARQLPDDLGSQRI